MYYRSSESDQYSNLIAKRNNLLSDLRFLAFKWCEYYGLPCTKDNVMVCISEAKNAPFVVLGIKERFTRVSKCELSQLETEINEGWKYTYKLYEKLRNETKNT